LAKRGRRQNMNWKQRKNCKKCGKKLEQEVDYQDYCYDCRHKKTKEKMSDVVRILEVIRNKKEGGKT